MRSLKTDKFRDLIVEQGAQREAAEEENPAVANPALKIPNGEAAPIYFRTGSGMQLVNVVFLLINEQLGAAMERFHCCMCPVCASAVTKETLRQLPPIIIEVRRKDDEKQVNEVAEKYRASVTHVIAKSVISVKSNPPAGHKPDYTER